MLRELTLFETTEPVVKALVSSSVFDLFYDGSDRTKLLYRRHGGDGALQVGKLPKLVKLASVVSPVSFPCGVVPTTAEGWGGVIDRFFGSLVPCSIERCTGERLRWTYHPSNVNMLCCGNLLSSCMQKVEAQPWLDLLVDNPEIFASWVVLNGGLVTARSLVVTLEDGVLFRCSSYGNGLDLEAMTPMIAPTWWRTYPCKLPPNDVCTLPLGHVTYKFWPRVDGMSYLDLATRKLHYSSYYCRSLTSIRGELL